MNDNPQLFELATELTERAAKRFADGKSKEEVVAELVRDGASIEVAELLAENGAVLIKCGSHQNLEKTRLPSGHNLVQLQEDEPINPSKMPDKGFHGFGTQWWSNTECPYAYKYLSLDMMYTQSYFESAGAGHPSYESAKQLYIYMQYIYKSLFGEKFKSILELGTGGGEITRHFFEANLELLAIEGTTHGIEKLLKLGLAPEQTLKRNLKFLEPLNRKFDIAMCTEVAEHIEPWFASKVVSNCVEHSDVVWFSAAKGDYRPHYHHINEAPIQAWDNIFANFGFRFHIALNGTMGRADRVYFNSDSEKRIKKQIK